MSDGFVGLSCGQVEELGLNMLQGCGAVGNSQMYIMDKESVPLRFINENDERSD